MKIYPKDYCVIITKHPNWYCKGCKKSHNKLYVNNINGEHHCDNCVPEDIKNKSIKINQNMEIIK